MAPFVAGLLKAGLGLVANAALAKGKEFIEQKTGVQLAPEMAPEDLARLRQFELEHEVELQQIQLEDNRLDAEVYKAELVDRQNARGRDIEFIRAGRANLRADILAYAAIAALVLCLVLAYLVELEGSQRDLVFTLVGSLVIIVKDVYGFEFGSSRGSKDKAAQLERKA